MCFIILNHYFAVDTKHLQTFTKYSKELYYGEANFFNNRTFLCVTPEILYILVLLALASYAPFEYLR